MKKVFSKLLGRVPMRKEERDAILFMPIVLALWCVCCAIIAIFS